MFSHGQPGIRAFGGVGMMIDSPGFTIRVARSAVDEFLCGDWEPRVISLIEKLRAEQPTGPLRVEVVEGPPAHAGLGSGTQLGMALADCLSALSAEARPSADQLACRAGRGLRSALGLHGYAGGGLMVEAGHRSDGEISPLITRVAVPEVWKCLLVRPRDAVGISGTAEVNGFARLEPMRISTTERLCRIAFLEIVPAMIENDFGSACAAIREYGQLVGDYFAPIQGAVFAHERIRRLEAQLIARGVDGYGQSSWGPTMFVLCPHADFAHDLSRELAATPEGNQCEYTVASPLNRGAKLELR
jgi:beta-RFAP synthase